MMFRWKTLAALTLLVWPMGAFALPDVFVQQGYVVNNNGQPLNGRFDITIRLYNGAQRGDVLFEENHPGVDIQDGLYVVAVGSQNAEAFSQSLFFEETLFLGISFDGGEELSPRTRITKIPAAFVADVALSVRGEIEPTAVRIAGEVVIDARGQWVGSPVGLRGPEGPQGLQGPAGAAGPVGPQGPRGAAGDAGNAGNDGNDGSPDTPDQVLAKIVTVDGTNSNLDADWIDGLTAGQFMRTDANTATQGSLQVGGALTVNGQSNLRSVAITNPNGRISFPAGGPGGGLDGPGLHLGNRNIVGANNIYIDDPGPTEGLMWNNSQARIVVSPLDNSNADGFLRLQNDEGISLESDVRITGTLTLAEGIDLADDAISGVANIHIADPGPDGHIAWDGTQATIYVSPQNDGNSDGDLRLKNDTGISLEAAEVHLRGATQLHGAVAANDQNVAGVNRLTFNDPGPDGAVAWAGADARIFVSPLDNTNADGQLRLQNDDGISLESDTRVDGSLRVEGDLNPDTISMSGAIAMNDHPLNGVGQMTINDPGPDGAIRWGNSQAQIYVAPANNGNADGLLKLVNDDGISLESDVQVSGDLTVSGAFSPDSLSLRGDAQFNDNDALGLNALSFADAGPDGAISWGGSDARIQVSPLDNSNADGYVRIINDGGISLESDVRVTGDLLIGGDFTLNGLNVNGASEFNDQPVDGVGRITINDAGPDGALRWGGTQAQVLVSPLNGDNTDGYLRFINDGGISMESDVRVTGDLAIAGSFSPTSLDMRGASEFNDNVIDEIGRLTINDPGPDGVLQWGGTDARIFVSPLNGDNVDGFLRLQNDGGISMEADVRVTGDLAIAGAFSPTSLDMRGASEFNDNNVAGLQQVSFNDPGPDGVLLWAGTQARIYVAPLNNDNTDGFLRLQNDDGISLESDTRVAGDLAVTGDFTVDGAFSPTGLDVRGPSQFNDNNVSGLQRVTFNDPGPDGVLQWGGTQARIYVAPLNNDNTDGQLRLQNDEGISLESNTRVAGNLDVVGHMFPKGDRPRIDWGQADGDCCYAALALANRNIEGVNSLIISDPGPSEGLIWNGSQAKIVVSPLDDSNSDGMLRLINDDAISLESDVRVTGTITVAGDMEIEGAFSPAGLNVRGPSQFNDNNVSGLQQVTFNDPGPDGVLQWGGTQAKIYVAPLDNANTDGYLRIQNDSGISLESDVRITGNITSGLSVTGNSTFNDHDVSGLQRVTFADPGPDGVLQWNGAQAKIYVAPLDDSNTDGYLRIMNDGGISLESTIRAAGNIMMVGARPRIDWADAGGDCCYAALAMDNRNIDGINTLYISDPGPTEGLIWRGSQAKIVVSPLDDANSDGYLRLINDGGISLESDVRITGNITSGLNVTGNSNFNDRNVSGLQEVSFADPGPDGVLQWSGTQAKIYVAPLDNGNTDGYLRLINDGGISLESDVRVTGDMAIDGAFSPTGLNVRGPSQFNDNNVSGIQVLNINDPGPDGRIEWGGSQAKIYVSPLDNSNSDGYLRLQNDGGISLESEVRTTKNIMLAGNRPRIDWANADGDCCYAALALDNRNIDGVNSLYISDPGPTEGLIWRGSQAKIVVAPLNDANSDGYLRLINDGGISLESDVRITGNITSGLNVTGNSNFNDRNVSGLQEVSFADPGPDGVLQWSGTQAKIYVAPLDNGNTDGYLRLINDGGISLESDVRVTGDMAIDGAFSPTGLNVRGPSQFNDNNVSGIQVLNINDPGPDGRIEWGGTQAKIYVAPLDDANTDGFLRIQNDGGIAL